MTGKRVGTCPITGSIQSSAPQVATNEPDCPTALNGVATITLANRMELTVDPGGDTLSGTTTVVSLRLTGRVTLMRVR